MQDVMHGQSTTLFTTDVSKALAEAIKSTNNALHIHITNDAYDSTFGRIWGGPMCFPYSLTEDGQIGPAGPAIYYGFMVTTALSAAAVNVRIATAAGAGTIIDTIAASAVAGTTHAFPYGVYCDVGVYADFGGTGTVTFFALPVA